MLLSRLLMRERACIAVLFKLRIREVQILIIGLPLQVLASLPCMPFAFGSVHDLKVLLQCLIRQLLASHGRELGLGRWLGNISKKQSLLCQFGSIRLLLLPDH